jgi:hypothetical protein
MKCSLCLLLEHLLKLTLIRNNISKFFEQEFNNIDKKILMEQRLLK